MELDERKLLVIGGVILITALVGLLILFAPSRKSHLPARQTTKPPRTTPAQQPVKRAEAPTSSPWQGSSYQAGPVSAELLAEIEDARRIDTENYQKAIKDSQIWLEQFMEDKSVSTFSRELYRIRNHPALVNGFTALDKKNPAEAKALFEETYNDPNTPLAVRFMAVKQLYGLAQQSRNPEEFFRWGKELGNLLATEDFSYLDEPKSSRFLEQMKEKELLFKARDNASMQQKLADFYMQSALKDTKPEEALKYVKMRIKLVEREVLGS